MTPEVRTKIEQIRHGNVPGGYKHSAVGVVPADWDVHLISDHLSESYVLGNMGDVAKKITVKLWNRGVCEKKEIHQGSENTQYYRRQKGQFIYSKLDFLNCAFGIIPSELDGYESTQDLPAFDIREINPYYLLAQVTQRRFYERWGIMVANGGRKARRISPDDFLTFPIAFPNRYEQDKIAEILITQDKVIELEQQIIEEIKKVKKFFLSKMFPKKGQAVPEIRFKGFTDAWEQRKLGEVASSFEYGLNAAAKEFDGVNKYLRITDIDDSSRVFKDDDLTSPDTDLSTAGGYQLHDGEILFARTGASVGKSFIYRESDGLVYYAGFLIRAKVKPEYDSEFIFQNTLGASYEKYIQITSQRSGQPGVNAQEYAEYTFLVPDYTEQKKIGGFLRQIDNLITLHQRKLEEEKQKKKALMQLLLTGIVRV